MYIKNQLSAELKSLKAISQKARKALKGAPEEALVCSRSNGNIQFYSRKKSDVKATHGTYIKKKDRALAAKLAQAEYERTVLQIADDQIKVLNKFLSNYIADPIQKAYEMMPEDKRNLVKPHILTDEQYANEWIAQKYTGLAFMQGTAVFQTESGENVRSKSEKMIADKLRLLGIPYRYECPLMLYNTKTVYPDFTLLNVKARKVLFYEHFGMMDDPVYAANAITKLHEYQASGLSFGKNFMATFESKSDPLDLKVMERIIRTTFANMENI